VVNFVPARHNLDQALKRILVPKMGVMVKNARQEMEADRLQVPLILAWYAESFEPQCTACQRAITIHKSQGQTIERLRVDLRKTFADGKANSRGLD